MKRFVIAMVLVWAYTFSNSTLAQTVYEYSDECIYDVFWRNIKDISTGTRIRLIFNNGGNSIDGYTYSVDKGAWSNPLRFIRDDDEVTLNGWDLYYRYSTEFGTLTHSEYIYVKKDKSYVRYEKISVFHEYGGKPFRYKLGYKLTK